MLKIKWDTVTPGMVVVLVTPGEYGGKGERLETRVSDVGGRGQVELECGRVFTRNGVEVRAYGVPRRPGGRPYLTVVS